MRKKYSKKHNRAATSNRVMVQCATTVNRDAVRRESIDGIEHIIVSSFTLPDDIVMNGGFYPAEEIAKSFHTLNRTFAPIEHPIDSHGDFVSASDPVAVHNFDAGAFNTNVTQENGRIHIEKHINVQVALKTDRGKRLLDRINELETSEAPRPIHTSVGVFIDVEETDGVQTNEAGQEFTWVASNMFFDHDAILLDNVGAAQPSQGVGMAVNAKGERCKVDVVTLNADGSIGSGSGDVADDGAGDVSVARDMRPNDEHNMSFTELHNAVIEGLERSSIQFSWIEELFSEDVIFRSGEDFFTVPFKLDETTGLVTIVGIPLPVERNVTFIPKVNSEGDEAMFKEMVLNALKAASIDVEGLTDEELVTKYNELQANQSEGDGAGAGNDNAADLATVVANALKPLTEQIGALESQMNAQTDKDKSDLVAIVASSDKYPAIDEETAKLIPVDKLREMSANCGTGYGIPLVSNSGADGDQSQRTEMPE